LKIKNKIKNNMKKILLLMMCWPTMLAAQNGVKVSALNVDAGTVTFNVSWDKNAPELQNIVWFDSVWVFVDYNAGGTMKRLPLAPNATLTATSAPDVGQVIQYPDNEKGVWVVGNAKSKTNSSGSFSATVKLLTATADIAGACAYASNYPPVGEYATASSITFTGTPPFDLVLSSGNVSVPKGYELVGSETLVSFTDKTGAPGIIKCIPPTVYTLTASAPGFCADDVAGVTFSLDGTQSGVKYQLYRDGTAVGTELTGTGSAQTFSGSFNVAGVYTAKSVAESGCGAVLMTGSHNIVAYSAITAGTIESGSKTTDAGTNPNVTIGSDTDASGGSGSYTYLWLRTGTGSPATLTTGDNATAYTIAASDCPGGGTYYFNRYAKDKACVTAVWVAASGTYTLGVESVVTNYGCTFTQPAVVGTFASFNAGSSTYVTLTDARDGKNYAVVKIGTRWIMAQNLNYQGVAGTSSSLTWQANSNQPVTNSGGKVTALIGHFWCPGTSGATFSNRASCDVWGALYSWETAMMVDGKWTSDEKSSSTWSEPTAYGTYTTEGNTLNHARRDDGAAAFGGRGICPPNWHVPTDGEWGDILNAMESGSGTNHNTNTGWMGTDACSRAKADCTCEIGTCADDEYAAWTYYTDYMGSDVYGFRALPSGYRFSSSSRYMLRGSHAYLWSSTANSDRNSWSRGFSFGTPTVNRSYALRSDGHAVRCIRN
jgi:uncharacterized protein (TIGR02145 family)